LRRSQRPGRGTRKNETSVGERKETLLPTRRYASSERIVVHNQNSGFTDEDMKPFPHLLKWIGRIAERPAVKTGTGEKYSADSKDKAVTVLKT